MKGRGKSLRTGGYHARPPRNETSMPEVDLHGLRYHIGETRLGHFMRDALAKGTPTVKIIHGHGQGVMRTLAYEWIETHANRVSNHVDVGPAVIVYLKPKP